MSTYTEAARDLAVDMVNTYDASADQELLDSPEALKAFAAARGFAVESVSVGDVKRLRRARQMIREAILAKEASEAVALLNEVLAASRPRPQLVQTDDETWTFAYSDHGAAVVDQILATASGYLLEEIREHGTNRFASCASTTCDDVFIDQSRNHSRRFCSAAVCGNRAAQRAYRERQSAAQRTQL